MAVDISQLSGYNYHNLIRRHNLDVMLDVPRLCSGWNAEAVNTRGTGIESWKTVHL